MVGSILTRDGQTAGSSIKTFPPSSGVTDTDAIHDNVSSEISAIASKSVLVDADLLIIEDSEDSNAKKSVQIVDLPTGSGTDADAIHDNVANEISAIAEKTTLVDADLLIIEDSAASGVKKKVQIVNLPSSGGGDTLPIVDSTAVVKGSSDATKLFRLEVDGNATGVTGVLAAAFSTAKTLTLPDATDTLIGKATTDILTNKSIDSDNNTITNIVNADIKTGAAITYAKLQDVSATNRILGRDTAGAGVIEEITPANLRTMINVEDNSTADQTDAEIRAAVEAATDSNVFDDTDHTKLDGIETSATIDQTDAEIRTAVEAATDSNVFTDADHTKLNAIEASAVALPVVDTTAIVKGSTDATKLLRLEVDGNTTGITGVFATSFTTAKTLTFPNATDTLVGKATVDVLTNKSIDQDGTGNSITNIADASIKAAAAIAVNKLAALTASRAMETDGSGFLVASAITSTELGFLNNASSEIQAQIDTHLADSVDPHTSAMTVTASITSPLLFVETLRRVSGDITFDSFQASTLRTLFILNSASGGTANLNVETDIIVGGLVDGRDVLADGTALDLVEPSATADQTDAEIRAAVEAATDSNVFTDADHTKLNASIASLFEDANPQLAKMLDVNTFGFGDGTLELLSFIETGSAINELTITNAAIGNGPSLTATGDDTDIDLVLDGKGTGLVKTLSSSLSISGRIECGELMAAGTLTLDAFSSGGDTLVLIRNEHASNQADLDCEQNIFLTADLRFTERADHHVTSPAATFGYLWVKDTAPTTLIFTDDTGVDITLGAGGGGGDVTAAANTTDNRLIRGDTTDKGIQNSNAVTLSDTDQIDEVLNISYVAEHDNGNSGTSFTVDWAANDQHQKVVLTGNCTFTFTAPLGVGTHILKLVQDTTGTRLVTWPSTVKWTGGTKADLSTAVNDIDIIAFYFDGTDYHASLAVTNSS